MFSKTVYAIHISHQSALSQSQFLICARRWCTFSQAIGRGSSWIYVNVSIHQQQCRKPSVSSFSHLFVPAASQSFVQNQTLHWLLPIKKKSLHKNGSKLKEHLHLQQTVWFGQCWCVTMGNHQNRQSTRKKMQRRLWTGAILGQSGGRNT